MLNNLLNINNLKIVADFTMLTRDTNNSYNIYNNYYSTLVIIPQKIEQLMQNPPIQNSALGSPNPFL